MVKPTDITITSLDEKLLQKALDLVEKNMADPDFSVTKLSHQLGMSRGFLHKKTIGYYWGAPL